MANRGVGRVSAPSEAPEAVEERRLAVAVHEDGPVAVVVERGVDDGVLAGVDPRFPPRFALPLGSDFRSGALPFPSSRRSISFSLFPIPPVFGPFSLFPRENGSR